MLATIANVTGGPNDGSSKTKRAPIGIRSAPSACSGLLPHLSAASALKG
jgi:hypothetical protein